MSPMTLIVLSVAFLIAAFWSVLAVRMLLEGRRVRLLRPVGGGPPVDGPSIDVVMPAHNEERHVEATVESVLSQDYPHLRLIVVNDQSTDSTGAILKRLANRVPPERLKVLEGIERPAGWVGKTWAVHQGAEQSRTEWLSLIDADMTLDPRAISTAWREAVRSDADLVSFLPGADCFTFWQRAVGLVLGQILAQLYPLSRVNDPSRPEALAAGGFILVRRATYDRIGGHAALRHEIVEDIQLARRVKTAGGTLSVHPAPSLVKTHMYGGLGDIWRGLRKNAFAGMDYQLHKFVVGAVAGLVLLWTPVLALFLGVQDVLQPEFGPAWPWLLAGAWGWSAQALWCTPMLVFLKLPIPYAFTLPVGGTAFIAITTSSVWHHLRGRILWKGRVYDPRSLSPKAGNRESPSDVVADSMRPADD